jgi:hypothetical protein
MPASSAVAAPRLAASGPHTAASLPPVCAATAPQFDTAVPWASRSCSPVARSSSPAPRRASIMNSRFPRSVAQAPLLAVPVRWPPVAAQHAAIGLPWCLCESVARAEPTRHSRNTRRGGLFREKRLRLFSVVHRRLRAVPGVMPSHTEGRHAYRLAATDCRNLGSASPTGPRSGHRLASAVRSRVGTRGTRG